MKECFDMQEAFQVHQGYDIPNMTELERAEYIKTMTLMLEDETHEMLREIPFFKPWKRYSHDPSDNYMKWAKARSEFVDMFHFFMNIALGLGFTADELVEQYKLEHQKNYDRQKQPEYKRDTDEA